jgi:NADPH:quinone reductase-like Zn-dependent oxidoreductase
MMKAAVLRAPGGFDRIKVHNVPDPHQPGPGQIRVALHATSLNYHDLLVANGTIPAADGRVLMSDGAGVVESSRRRRNGVQARRPCRFLLLPSMAGWVA